MAGKEISSQLDSISAKIEDKTHSASILDYRFTRPVMHGKEGHYSSDGSQRPGSDQGSPLGVLYDDDNGALRVVH